MFLIHEMVQGSKALTVLPEDWEAPYNRQFTTAHNSSLKGPNALSGLFGLR